MLERRLLPEGNAVWQLHGTCGMRSVRTFFSFVVLFLVGSCVAGASDSIDPDPGVDPSEIGAPDAGHLGNPVQSENARPGTSSWQLTNPATANEIEGYASKTSVNRGQSISLLVNTSDSSYAITIYRMGWYGGLGARQMIPPIVRSGRQQPIATADPSIGFVEAVWTDPYVLTVPQQGDWTSGVYLAKLTGATSHKQSYVIFVVRDDNYPSHLLFQSSVTTFQAYNRWGGFNFYPNANNETAVKISFNRPYLRGNGAGDFFKWEYYLVRFLEREGYDVSYATNVDMHINPSLLRSHYGFLSVGHDEYWSWEMRANVQMARDRGVNLGFFGANTMFWQIRLEPSPATGQPNRTIVCYKYAAATDDPFIQLAAANPGQRQFYLSHVTTQWRRPPVNLPEDAITGVMYHGNSFHGDIVIQDDTSWVLRGTDLRRGDRLLGLLGYETDAAFPTAPPGLQIIAHSPDPWGYSDMAVYTAPSGATVFATGSMQWNWGLDALPPNGKLNAAAQQMTRNVLARLQSRAFW
jgi:hypothetical protein